MREGNLRRFIDTGVIGYSGITFIGCFVQEIEDDSGISTRGKVVSKYKQPSPSYSGHHHRGVKWVPEANYGNPEF